MQSIIKAILEGKWYFPAIIVIAPLVVFTHIGMTPMVAVNDSLEYNGYAANMMAGHGYSIDGQTFSILREPGYPMFLVLAYSIVGINNLEAIFLMQLLMLGLIGCLVYFFFARQQCPYFGSAAGLFTAVMPSYGLLAHDIATETLFALLLTCLFVIASRVVEENGKGKHLFLWFGILSACAALVRFQLVLFVPFLLVVYLFVYRKHPWKDLLTNCLLALMPLVFIVGGWMLFVHQHTGKFAVTEGRQEIALYGRAVRAELSYGELTRYALQWVKRSVTGGTYDPFLDEYEYHKFQDDYALKATTTEAKLALKKWSIQTILDNPGHYLYGNLIELMKLTYLHHDYGDTINRYIRAGVYVTIYALFLFGIYQLLRKGDSRLKAFALLALMFIVYNWLVLTPFDTAPRYNVPYLQFYLIIGFLGVILWRSRIKETKKKSEFFT